MACLYSAGEEFARATREVCSVRMSFFGVQTFFEFHRFNTSAHAQLFSKHTCVEFPIGHDQLVQETFEETTGGLRTREVSRLFRQVKARGTPWLLMLEVDEPTHIITKVLYHGYPDDLKHLLFKVLFG